MALVEHIYMDSPYHDRPLFADRLQNRALLYRLAVALEPVRRSELAFLFWPDVSDACALRLLTQLLSHVRRILPEEIPILLDLMDILIDRHMEQRQFHTAIELATRYLSMDELAEDVYRRLIECYAATGKRSNAVHQYEQCVRILARELGLTPLPETVAVYHQALVFHVDLQNHVIQPGNALRGM